MVGTALGSPGCAGSPVVSLLGRARLGVLQATPPLHGQGFLLHPHGLRRQWGGNAGAPQSGSPCPRVSPSAHPLPRQTQRMYKWAEPKICNEELPQAARLPPSEVKTRCPPCNPGFAKGNSSTCQPCPYGFYSNGSGNAAPSLSPKRDWGSLSC